ncbi:MAG: leucine-rich repeat domain-containing protein [Myxococcota bacterium]
MSDLYSFSVLSVEERIVRVAATRVHPDAGGFAATKNFALQILYGPLYDWTDVGEAGRGGDLDQAFSQDDFTNDDYLRLVCHEYIEKVQVTDRSGDDAVYVIELTAPKWGAHLKAGMSWDSADYNRGPDLPRPKTRKGDSFGPRKRVVRWGGRKLRVLSSDTFAKATGLKILDLSKNHLQRLPDNFGDMGKLEVLDLSDNLLRTLPDSFCDLTSLRELDLRGNQLTSLPENFGKLENLEVLHLSKTNDSMPDMFPESFSELSKLRILQAQGSGLKRYPREFRRLQALEELYIGNCAGEYLIEGLYEICHIPRLRIFHAFALSTLPREFGNLVNLEALDIASCSLHKLPDTFGNLTRLRSLKAYSNKLRIFPPSLRPLAKSLRYLNLQSNLIDSIPDWIAEFEVLETFLFERNQITGLPRSIGQMPQLKWLDIRCNNIETLPDSLGDLKTLETLQVGQCELTSLPESLKSLPNLQRLEIHSNPLDTDVDAWKAAMPDTHIWS